MSVLLVSSRTNFGHAPWSHGQTLPMAEPNMRYAFLATYGPQTAAEAVTPGDWLSGRALPSHGRGHWFEPSIAHEEAHEPAGCSSTPRALTDRWWSTMPVTGQTTATANLCHPPPCATPQAMERQRQRAAAARPARIVTPGDAARWRRAHKCASGAIPRADTSSCMERWPAPTWTSLRGSSPVPIAETGLLYLLARQDIRNPAGGARCTRRR